MTKFQFSLTKALFLLAGASLLSLTTGCPGKEKKETPKETTEVKDITLQMIYDEAAKGPGSTNLETLHDMYKKKVTSTVEADELNKIGPADAHFMCLVVDLPTVKETREILEDFVPKLTDPINAINKDCKNSAKVIDRLIDPARSGTGDEADDADEMIKFLVEKGNDETVARASDKAKVERVLGAVKKKGDQTQLTKVFKHAPAALRDDLFAWGIANTADTKIVPAMRGAAIVNDDMVFAEAQKGAGANTALLNFLYDVAINTDAEAAALAAKAAVANLFFSHYFAALVPDANLAETWRKYVGHLRAGGGNPAVVAQSRLDDAAHTGAATFPINRVLAHVIPLGAAAAETARNKIVKLLVEGGIAAVTADVTAANVSNLLTAMRIEGTEANFQATFSAMLGAPGLKANALTWAVAYKTQHIGGLPANHTIAQAIAGLPAITPVMVGAELQAAAGDAARLANFKLLYNAAIKGNHANARLLADLPAVGNLSSSHILAGLVPDDDLVAIWGDYLALIHADAEAGIGGPGAGDPAVLAQILLDDAAHTGAATFPINRVLALVIAPGGGAAAAETARKKIVKLLVGKDIPAVTADVTAANVSNLLTAMRIEGTEANFQATFSEALGVAALQANAIAWAEGNKTQRIGDLPANHTIAQAIAGLPAITPAIVGAELQAAPGDAARLANFKLLYNAAIKGNSANARLLADLPAVGNLSSSHILAGLVPDDDLVAIWGDYLALIHAEAEATGGLGAGDPAVLAQILLDDAAATGAATFPINRVLALVIAPGGGAAAIETARNKIVKLLVEKNIAGVTARVEAANVAKLLTAMRIEGTEANFKATLSAALGVPGLKANALTWAEGSKGQRIGDDPAKHTITEAIAGLAAITPAMVGAELQAAPGDAARLANFKLLYEAGIKGKPAQARLLADLPAVANLSSSHILASLVPDDELFAIWGDYLAQIHAEAEAGGVGNGDPAVLAQILLNDGVPTGAATFPINRVLAHVIAAGPLAAAAETARNKIVKLLVGKAIPAVTARVTAANVPNLLTAMRKEETAANFLAVFNALLGAAAPEKAAAIGFVRAKPADTIEKEAGTPTVEDTIEPRITYKILVDEAKAASEAVALAAAGFVGGGPGYAALQAKARFMTENVKFLYYLRVTDQTTANHAKVEPASGPLTADRLSHFLARLAVEDADLLALWTHFFTQINVAVDMEAQINLAGAGGVTPFQELIAARTNYGDVAAELNKIITLFLAQGNQATVRSATGMTLAAATPKVAKMLEAVRDVGPKATLKDTLMDVDATDANAFGAAIAWAMSHRHDDIAASGTADEVLSAVSESKIVTDAILLAEAQAGVPEFKKVLFYVQVLVTHATPATQVTNAQRVAALNDGAGNLLHHLIVAKPQDPESVSALKYYLHELPSGGAGGPGTWEAARDAADSTGQTAAQTLADPLRVGGPGDYAGATDTSKALLIFESAAATPQPAPPGADPIANQAP